LAPIKDLELSVEDKAISQIALIDDKVYYLQDGSFLRFYYI